MSPQSSENASVAFVSSERVNEVGESMGTRKNRRRKRKQLELPDKEAAKAVMESLDNEDMSDGVFWELAEEMGLEPEDYLTEVDNRE